MRIGLVNIGSLHDIPFYWTVRALIDKFGALADVFVPVVPEMHAGIDDLPLPLSDLLTQDREFDCIVLFGADKIDSEWAFLLSAYKADDILVVANTGSEADLAAVASRLEYAFGATVGLLSPPRTAPVLTLRSCAFVSARGAAGAEVSDRSILVTGLDDEADDKVLKVLLLAKRDRVVALTRGAARARLLQLGVSSPVFQFSEVAIGRLLANIGVVVDLSASLGGDLHKLILLNAADLGIPLVAATTLAQEIRPLECYPVDGEASALEFARRLRDSPTSKTSPSIAGTSELEVLERRLDRLLAGEPRTASAPGGTPNTQDGALDAQDEPEPLVWLAPINGSGLGHIKRLANIAAQMPPDRLRFCGFGGAIDGISSLGFDVVPLVGHVHGKGNRRVQLLNYRRLTKFIRRNDCFVFDGGHPYDGVVAAIENLQLEKAVWVRRGLFRQDQENQEALGREKYFRHIILPLEIFPELNEPEATFGAKEERVNPIVDLTDKSLGDYDLGFDLDKSKRIVVTMLGGGDTREVSGEVYAICDELRRFPDVIHILMDWPKSNYTDSGRVFSETRVVRTMWAGFFIRIADLVVSAAGYNTFNEITYGRRPALYVPQSAPWMDDQRRRAEAARERGIAEVCPPGDVVGLRSAIKRMLAGSPTALEQLASNARRLELPEPGNAVAGRLLMEVADGRL